MVTYKEQLHTEMLELAKNPLVRFVGYNTAYGPKMNGTLIGCEKSCIETPVAENLMCGIAMGLALKGYLPVLCFERMDFCLAGADALINHIMGLQQYGLVLPMIIRVCVGQWKPLDPGSQHTQDYSNFFPCERAFTIDDIKQLYATKIDGPYMFVEYRGLYETRD